MLKGQNTEQKQINKLMLYRLQMLQNKIVSTNNGNVFPKQKQNMENSSKLENKLFEMLKNNMQKADKNNINNLQRLEQHINDSIDQVCKKSREFQNSILLLLQDKETILTDIEYRISTLESNNQRSKQMKNLKEKSQNTGMLLIKERVNEMQELQQMRHKALESMLKKLKENYQLDMEKSQQRIQEFKEHIEQEIQQASKNIQRNNVQGPQLAKSQESNENINLSLYDQKIQEIHQKIKILTLEHKEQVRTSIETKNKISLLESQINSAHNKLNLLHQQTTLDNGHVRISSKSSTKNQPYQNMNYKLQKMTRLKNPLMNYKEPEAEKQISSMRGGIRGLLQKSKEKQVHQTNSRQKQHFNSLENRNRIFPHKEDLRKQYDTLYKPGGLPPVKSDLKHKNNMKMHNRNSEEMSEEEVTEYNVDQEGFLVDEEGNYLVDEYGDNIQLSQEDMNQLIRQQNAR